MASRNKNHANFEPYRFPNLFKGQKQFSAIKQILEPFCKGVSTVENESSLFFGVLAAIFRESATLSRNISKRPPGDLNCQSGLAKPKL